MDLGLFLPKVHFDSHLLVKVSSKSFFKNNESTTINVEDFTFV